MIAATRIASAQTDDPARRFRTAPPDVGRQKVIADIVLNGIDVGTHEILVDGPKVTIPHSVLQDVRLGNLASDALELQPGGDTEFGFDPKTSTLDLKVGAARLQALRIGPAGDASAPLALSPEAWGGWVNYDGNIRRGFGAGVPRRRPVDGGAFAELNLTGPDFLGYSSWSYDSARDAGQATVRLDTYGTWRPSDKTLSATVGDDVSDSPGTARPFRYAGIEVGTDHSAQPGFSQSPIASITGNAAAQSSIDVYIDNQRISRSSTSGGPFTFAVPTGSASNRIVVTDVTGRQTIVTAEAPLVDAQTISEGLLLWSAGLGVARFDYGSASNHYGEDPYAHATGRYGVTDRLTATSHVEGGGGPVRSRSRGQRLGRVVARGQGQRRRERVAEGEGSLRFRRTRCFGSLGPVPERLGDPDDGPLRRRRLGVRRRPRPSHRTEPDVLPPGRRKRKPPSGLGGDEGSAVLRLLRQVRLQGHGRRRFRVPGRAADLRRRSGVRELHDERGRQDQPRLPGRTVALVRGRERVRRRRIRHHRTVGVVRSGASAGRGRGLRGMEGRRQHEFRHGVRNRGGGDPGRDWASPESRSTGSEGRPRRTGRPEGLSDTSEATSSQAIRSRAAWSWPMPGRGTCP